MDPIVEDLWRIVSVVVLVLINAFFVAAEYSFVSARRTRIKQLAEEGSIRARLVQRAMRDTNRYIATTQAGVTLMSLLLGAIGEPAIEHIIEPLFTSFLPHNAAFVSAAAVSFIIALALVTYVEIVLGEQVPKMLALQKAEGTVLVTAPITLRIALLIRPIIAAIYWGTRVVLKAVGLKYQSEQSLVYTEEELMMLVTASTASGVLEKTEERIINRVLTFTDLTASQVMVPRTEISAVPVTISLQELTNRAIEERHTRYPVYDGTLDNIIGVVHTKDLVRVLSARQPPARFRVTQILRDVLSVPETQPLDDLLTEMQRRRNHMAIVIDEYGGTSGLVTLEDVLERIVGNVQDEFEAPEPDVRRLPDGSLIVNGLLSVDDFNEVAGTELSETDFNTIGGVVFGQLGRKPEVGDEVELDFGRLRVEALDGLRVARVRAFFDRKPAQEAVEE